MTATLQAPEAPELPEAAPSPTEATVPSLTSVEGVLADIRRNPLLVTVDLSDAPPARSFRAHRAAVTEAIQDQPLSSLVAVVQRHPKGFWISEWTLIGTATDREPRRRRIVRGTSLEAAYAEFSTLLSFDSSHFFYPEEGLRGWWQRA